MTVWVRNVGLKGKIKLSEVEKNKILDQIGEASGRDVKILLIATNLKNEIVEQAIESWEKWYENLGERMVKISESWYSEYSPVWNQDKLITAYTNYFIKDLSAEIDEWGNKQFKDIILQENLNILNANIEYEIDAIQAQFQNLDVQVNASFSEELKISINGISDDFMGLGGIGGGVGIGGLLATGLLAFTGIGFIAIIFASVAAAIAGSFGLGMLDIDGLHDQIKMKVLEMGFEKFNESIEKVGETFGEIIDTVVDKRVESASQVIKQVLSHYENLLEQQEKAHQSTLEEREVSKAWINSKRQELEQVRNEIQAIIKIS